MLDGNGCVAPQHTEPQGVGLPHRAPGRVCAVFGNVIDPASVLRVKDVNGGDPLLPGVAIDLYIENTTAYTANTNVANHVKTGGCTRDSPTSLYVGCAPTFGEINLKGPDSAGTSSVGLTFTFKRRDTGAEVQIPWMQFTLFDFDHNMWPAGQQKGLEVNPTPAPAPPHPVRIAPTDLRSRGAWPESQCATASGFEDYAVSSGPGVISSGGGAPVTTRVDMQSLNFQGGINTGARTCTQAASPHAATPARRLCAADATPLRTAQGNGARWTGAPEATTRPTR